MGPVFPQVGMVEGGKFHPKHVDAFKRQFAKFEGGLCEVVVRSVETKRSNRQNRYMWGIAYKLISEHTGYTTNEIHQYLCSELLEVSTVRGKVISGSTSGMNTKQMEEYLERVRAWAGVVLNISVPLPSESE